MTEVVYRRRRRRRTRLMDERRFAVKLPSRAAVRAVLLAIGQGLPALLLALADLLDMPSGLHAAYVASLAALQLPVRWPLAGAGAAMLLRWISGLDARPEGLVTLAMLAFAPKVLPGRKNPALLLFTGVSLLPMVIRGWLAPTALPALMAMFSLAFSVLCAPVICRGVKAVLARDANGHPARVEMLEDRMGVAALAWLLMCGGAQVMLPGVNVGMAMACAGVMLIAAYLGAGMACAAGIIAGMGLSLMGLPMMLSVALAAGGFMAGAMQATGRRWLCPASFGGMAMLTMVLSGTAGQGCGGAVVLTAVLGAFLPQRWEAFLHAHMQRLRPVPDASCDAYAASTLAAWERTVDAMAMSIPMPGEPQSQRDGAWWTERLCSGCGAEGECPGLTGDAALAQAEAVWAYREADEPLWQGALEGLRGLGCQRLHHLMRSMDALRHEEASAKAHVMMAREQRSMLVTHLTAMAGAARRFAHLSAGESWWDAVTARRIRAALSDAAAPVRLMWLRRVQGHVQAVFRLEDITHARGQAAELCELVSAATGAAMMTVSVDQGCVRLAQCPPMKAVCGVSCLCSDGQRVCGDTAWSGLLQDGRFMAAVCDGMGHGEAAALSSRQTVELMRLCLDAGYTLQQTITAVNGMMLLGGSGERFIAVDLFCADLWTGQAWLEKMGAAASWLHQNGALCQLTGDALPLGILEGAEAGEQLLRLGPGDAVVLMTDGVEDAFSSRDALKEAIREALSMDPVQGADHLLQEALNAAGGVRQDDQTVLILRMMTGQGV